MGIISISIIGALIFWIPISIFVGYLFGKYKNLIGIVKGNFEFKFVRQKKTQSAGTDKVQ